jgi:hypothetical protein
VDFCDNASNFVGYRYEGEDLDAENWHELARQTLERIERRQARP